MAICAKFLSSLADDYSEYFVSGSLGPSLDIGLPVLGGASLSAGKSLFFAPTDLSIWGTSNYVSISAGLGGFTPFWEVGGNVTYYVMDVESGKPYVSPDNKVLIGALYNDIRTGNGSPWYVAAPVGLEWLLDTLNYIDLLTDPASGVMGAAKRRVNIWEKLAVDIPKYARAYEEVRRP